MPRSDKTSFRYIRCCAFAINATAIIFPSTLINWLGFKAPPCFATKSSSGRITSSFISATIEELATIAEVYSAGLPCIPGTFIFWCSDVRLVVTSAPVQAAAPAPTV